jgi:hypothetical protein
MAMVAVVAAFSIMIWFTISRIKTEIQSAATAATACRPYNHGWLPPRLCITNNGRMSFFDQTSAVTAVGTVPAIQG